MIRKVGSKWVLFTKDGSKRLGTHDSKAEAEAQERAIEASKHRSAEQLRELHLIGATGTVRTETYDGREFLIVPVIALMEGVIHAINADTPEFVPADRLAAAAPSWNGRSLVIGHPTKDGHQISANDPVVLQRQAFGTVFASRMNGQKLSMDAWVDVKRLETLGQHDFLARLRAGDPIEVSVGAFVRTNAEEGEYHGKRYLARWTDIVGDHLAFLPNGRGACSLEMGCGAHRAASYLVTAEGMRALDNPEGINQYSKGQTVRFDGKSADGKVQGSMNVKIVDPHSNADKVTRTTTTGKKSRSYEGQHIHIPTATVENSRGTQFEAYHHTLKGAEMNKRSLRERVKALIARAAQPYDSPSEAASEEAAELIGYQTMKTLLDQVSAAYDDAQTLVDDLISDEVDDPTETAVDEEAEEEVEAARLESLQTLCSTMISALSNVMSMTYKLQLPDLPDYNDVRYNEALRTALGARNSKADMKIIQASHDATHEAHGHAVALGATCNGMKLLAEKTCACGGSSAKGEDMTKAERVAALLKNEHNPLKDQKALEAATDDSLKALETHCENAATLKATADKIAADDKAKADAEAAKLKAAEDAKKPEIKSLSEEDFMKMAPPSIKALIEDKKAEDAARKTGLIASLKVAQTVYSEDELKAMDMPQLSKIAQLADVKTPDFSGRGVPIQRAASETDVYANPPDGYALALAKQRVDKTVN